MRSVDSRSSSSLPQDALSQRMVRINVSTSPENVAEMIGPFVTPDMLPDKEALRGSLSGKVAVITGSTQGIGEATARFFGEIGMKVAVNGRLQRQELGENIAREISESGSEAVFVPADVTTQEGAEQLIEGAINAFGRVDVVVNNVGTKKDNLLITMKQSEWYDVMRTNADSAMFVTQAAAKKMARNKDPRGGNIISVSSLGVLGLPGQANYAASKAAMEAVARTAASEYSTSREISVGVLRLGLVKTPLTEDLSEKQREALKTILGTSDELRPQEVAHAIAYLATLKEPNIVNQLTLLKK